MSGTASPNEIYNSIANQITYHERLVEPLEELRLLMSVGPFEHEAPCVEITGPSGVGKTTLFKCLQQEFPRVTGACKVKLPRRPEFVADRLPFVWITLMQEPTLDAICNLILKAYGDELFDQGNIDNKTDRIDRFIGASGTVAWFIDEAQFLVDRNGVVVAERIVDWFRKRFERSSRAELGLPGAKYLALVFFGLGRLDYILTQDGQVERRWDAGYRMEPYKWKGEDKEAFKDVLFAFREASLLPFATDIDFDSDVDMYRFHYATRGIIGNVKKLLKRVALLSLKPSSRSFEISWALLEEAFDREFRRKAHATTLASSNRAQAAAIVPMQNPFSISFNPKIEPPPVADDRALLPPTVVRRRKKLQTIRRDAAAAFGA